MLSLLQDGDKWIRKVVPLLTRWWRPLLSEFLRQIGDRLPLREIRPRRLLLGNLLRRPAQFSSHARHLQPYLLPRYKCWNLCERYRLPRVDGKRRRLQALLSFQGARRVLQKMVWGLQFWQLFGVNHTGNEWHITAQTAHSFLTHLFLSPLCVGVLWLRPLCREQTGCGLQPDSKHCQYYWSSSFHVVSNFGRENLYEQWRHAFVDARRQLCSVLSFHHPQAVLCCLVHRDNNNMSQVSWMVVLRVPKTKAQI